MNLPLRYKSTRAITEALCAPLSAEDCMLQASEFVSPAKWHLAHTTWFFEAFVLQVFLPEYRVFASHFSYLFNSYYQAEGERIARGDRAMISRPALAEIYAYRAHVDASILKLCQNCPDNEKLKEVITLGLNHEQQHQELMRTDIKYNLAQNPIHPVYQANEALCEFPVESAGWVDVKEGIYEIGYTGRDFCFDNEKGRHKVYLPDFSIAKALVTNEEYRAFIEDGGYQRSALWLDEGWAWLQNQNRRQPLYWLERAGDWFHFSLAGLRRLPMQAAVCHVNYYEAQAFAAWKSMRLPTEYEWEAASGHFKWGQRWEWTGSSYLPYPGYRAAEGALGEYNGKFMVNQMVLRGASVATAEGHSRNTYRNFFHPHLQWQYTGIRLVR